ncbi:hypothetical protein WOLCODRAFT_105294 [Wolfiporia cocos MD-104 SS10]|uniref:Uncharacterized protein n=1 Tax=Wolfiporia cocos (strain MD-104) TaxID=742152 RepID=A0A2H3JQX5_WOLCO|nr:hypothetical protein WOLCODRAFT_105294 [Wolfiporia cocos MD-104 SS10]
METAWDVYAKLLWEKGYGYPLWSPEPHEKGEVDIGDVGFIWEGRFYCLLNASKPSDADVNQRWGDLGPFNFQSFRIDPTYQLDDPRRICTRMLSSSSITTFEVSSKAYTCTDDRAALLFLPSGAAHGRSYISKGIKDYIRQNEGEWYRIVAEHTQLDIKQGDLMFVTGWIKTSDYFLAACTHGAHVGSISLDAGIGGKAGISVTISGSKDVAPGWEQRTSLRPHNEDMNQSNASGSDGRQSDRDTNDQCIFIQYHKTKRRGILASLLPKLKASAEFRDPDDPSRGNGGADDCTAFKCDESSSDGRATGASTPYGRIPSTKDVGEFYTDIVHQR